MNGTNTVARPLDVPHGSSSAQRAMALATAGASAMLGFFAPFSSAGTALSTAAVLLLVLARPRELVAAAPWREPVMAVGLLLLAFVGLHSLWFSGWTRTSLSAANHYQELLICPLLLAAWRDPRARHAFFTGLVAGLAALATAYWFTLAAPSAFPGFTLALGSRRISAGFGLALGTFLLLAGARLWRRPVQARVLAAYLAATVLFAMDGRTGQVVLLVLAAFAAWLAAPRRWRLAAALACPLALVALASLAPGVQTRVSETLRGTAPEQNGNLSSTGIRLEFARLSLDLAGRYWLTGAGYANYSKVHEQAAQARYAGDPRRAGYLDQVWVHTPNPHDEYAMQLVGGGIAGLGLYLAWLGLALRRGLAAPAPLRAMVAGTVVAFATGSLFNSLLMDFVEGHLYVSVLAALLAMAAGMRRPAP